MINCNENENDNDKIDHINKTYRNQDVDIETNIENIVCLGKTMFEAQLVKKVSNNEAELDKSVAYKKSVYVLFDKKLIVLHLGDNTFLFYFDICIKLTLLAIILTMDE